MIFVEPVSNPTGSYFLDLFHIFVISLEFNEPLITQHFDEKNIESFKELLVVM